MLNKNVYVVFLRGFIKREIFMTEREFYKEKYREDWQREKWNPSRKRLAIFEILL